MKNLCSWCITLALAITVGCGQDVSTTAEVGGAPLSPSQQGGRQQLLGQRPKEVVALKAIGPVPKQTIIDVAIGLNLRNKEERDVLLRDVYDPASPRFHQFLTPEQYNAFFAPTIETYQAVLDFAAKSQLTVVTTPGNRHHVHIRGNAAAINRAFDVTLQQYKHPSEERVFYAPDREPSVDRALGISFVAGLDDFHRRKHQTAGGSGPNGWYTGYDFRKVYAGDVPYLGLGQTVGIAVANTDGYITSDITTYESLTGLPNVPLQKVYLDGYTGSTPSDEITGDIEVALSMAPGLRQVTIYSLGNTDAAELDGLAEMASPQHGEPLPYQLSSSYVILYIPGGGVYHDFAQLTLQGQSLFISSGDNGSWNEAYTGTGAGAGDFGGTDDPHVVSVGGTVLTTTANGTWDSETTWFGSGGGYSPWQPIDSEFNIPAWQVGMNFAAFGGSSIARNAPDVSMVATNGAIYFNGAWDYFSGTSQAAPLWAGFMALVNQEALVRYTRIQGFLNPLLYGVGNSGVCPACFHDITTGNNVSTDNPNGYYAVPGYDLCTGWGTPNGQSMIDALITYPCPSGSRFEAGFGRCASNGEVAALWLAVQ